MWLHVSNVNLLEHGCLKRIFLTVKDMIFVFFYVGFSDSID